MAQFQPIIAGLFLIGTFQGAGLSQPLPSAEFASDLETISRIGMEGKGNVEAAEAWKHLVSATSDMLIPVLTAANGTNDLAANYFRSAVETIADRELAAGRTLPLRKLGEFLLDQGNAPRARRLAFELIARIDTVTADQMITTMVNDPSSDLRFDAVQKIVQQAESLLISSNKESAHLLFKQSLTFARDVSQIDKITKNLKTLGENINLPVLFGFIQKWKVIGPFDNTGTKGYNIAYPPEEGIDLNAEYDGKGGKVHWQDLVTTDDYGSLSMNKPFQPLKGAAAYAVTEFYSDKSQEAELRLGSENAWKLWLNGQYQFGQDEYHRNKAIDQYRMKVQLQPGRNVILVKVCQNEQKEDWADGWDFQLRVCDPLGNPIRSQEPSTSRVEAK